MYQSPSTVLVAERAGAFVARVTRALSRGRPVSGMASERKLRNFAPSAPGAAVPSWNRGEWPPRPSHQMPVSLVRLIPGPDERAVYATALLLPLTTFTNCRNWTSG